MRILPALCALALLLTGCPKKEEAPAPVKAATPVKTSKVNFFGEVAITGARPARLVFVAMQEPCMPVPAEAHLYGQVELPQQKLVAELHPPQNSQGHLCAYGLDAEGKIVGQGTYAKNPVTFRGEGEVIFGNVNLALEPVSPAVARPKGL